MVKGYEVKLSQEEAVPADLTAIQAHRSALQVGAPHFKLCTEKPAAALVFGRADSFPFSAEFTLCAVFSCPK